MKKRIFRFFHYRLGTRVAAMALAMCLGGAAVVCVSWMTAGASPRPSANKGAPVTYPVNAAGLTYGTVAEATSWANLPDLILAYATNGALGYIKKTELEATDGSNVSNPTQAAQWQTAHGAGWTATIPVYAQNGASILGDYVVESGTPLNTSPAPN